MVNLIDVWSFHVYMLRFVAFNHCVKENWFRKTCFISLSIVLDRVTELLDDSIRLFLTCGASNILTLAWVECMPLSTSYVTS